MSDTLGRIVVPSLVDSGLTFPFTSDMPYGLLQERPVVVHRFGELDAKAEQRFAVGIGPRKFAFRRQHLSLRDRATLATFWEGLQGPWKSFSYNAPNSDLSTTPTTVTWENAPLAFQYLANACQTGFNFIEVPNPANAPAYPVVSTCLRFPSSPLQTALLSQVQQVIPLVHIRVREAIVPDIYLSDRRVTVGAQLYLPRLLGIGEPGSGVILTQDIKGTADNVEFSFGNADRVMTQLANDTDLKYAQIDLSIFHVNSGILLQLWSGFITGYVSDGSAKFAVRASDGLYQLTQAYPSRPVSRQCWKTYDDGVACPWATHGASGAAVIAAGGDPTSCDYYFDSTNGCQVHGMAPYFGGHPALPQGVVIKDNSTGLWGIARSSVTATSIVSDSIWGNALQEIWCNDDGDPGKAFWVAAMIVAGRDESDFYDALGIVGAGPIGAFAAMQVYQNQDGYRYIIAPMLDGQPPQGFEVDGSLNIVKNTGMGLRRVAGNDPVDPGTDSFSLGQGTPQVWGPEMAAGTAFVEIRRTDEKGIQPTTADSHQMQVPISKGLAGWIWDQYGTRSAAPGLTNPFWVAVNTLLRALGIFGAASADQLARFVLPSLIVGDGSGAAEIADDAVTPVVSINNGEPVLSITVDVAGAGYTTATVYFTGGGGSGAAATAHITIDGPPPVNGHIDSITVVNGGYGFTRAPDVVITGDGDGTAAAHATLFAPANTEKQFRFQGVLAQQKPARDWLVEILASALGYFTWEFGKLKLGARINASAVEAFTVGNILLQSLRMEPLDAAFEHLIIDFADQEYQYQANTAEYQDKTHAAYYGRAGSPLTARQHQVGCATLSQALRLAAVRTREEIGGVTPTEWRNARKASWKTTILALNTEAGQVVSMTHPDVPGARGTCNVTGSPAVNVEALTGDPFDASLVNKEILIGGTMRLVQSVTDATHLVLATALAAGSALAFQVVTGDFRIQSWRLNQDWSIDIQAQTVTPSMYDLTVGPKPVDVRPPRALTIPTFRTAPYPWAGGITYDSFNVREIDTVGVDGAPQVQIGIEGYPPINAPAAAINAPTLLSVIPVPGSGSIAGGRTLVVGVVAVDATGLWTGLSNIQTVYIPPGSGYKLTLAIQWATGTYGAYDHQIFIGPDTDHWNKLIAGPSGTPATYDVTDIGASSTALVGPPDLLFEHLVLRLKREIPGVWTLPALAVGTNTIQFAGVAWTTNQWAGRSVACLATVAGHGGTQGVPYLRYFHVIANTSDTLTMDVGGMSLSGGGPTWGLGPGDVFGMRVKPGTVTANSLQDALWGLTAGALVGKSLRVIDGTGAGQPTVVVLANTTDTVTVSPAFAVLPDATSIIVIEDPAWQPEVATHPYRIPSWEGLSPSVGALPAPNAGQTYLVEALTVAADGTRSTETAAPLREIYTIGAQGTRSVTADATQLPTDGLVLADATAASFTYQCLAAAQAPNQDLTITWVAGGANTVTVQAATGEEFDTGASSVVLSASAPTVHLKFHGN